MHTCPPPGVPRGRLVAKDTLSRLGAQRPLPTMPSRPQPRLPALAPELCTSPSFTRPRLPQRSFTADRAEVRAERGTPRPADPRPGSRGGTHHALLAEPVKLLELLGHQQLGAPHGTPDLAEDCGTHTVGYYGRVGGGQERGCHARWPSLPLSRPRVRGGHAPTRLTDCAPQALVRWDSQARTLEGVVMPSSRDLPPLRDRTLTSLHWQVCSLPRSHLGCRYPQSVEVKTLRAYCVERPPVELLSIWSILIHEGNSKMTKY